MTGRRLQVLVSPVLPLPLHGARAARARVAPHQQGVGGRPAGPRHGEFLLQLAALLFALLWFITGLVIIVL